MILLKITERMISLRPSKQIYPIERIISAASYLTAGGAGFIWLLIAAIMKKHVTPFLLYHIMQSIFLSILYFIIATLAELVYAILYRIPLINAIPYFANMPLPFFIRLISDTRLNNRVDFISSNYFIYGTLQLYSVGF